MKRLAGLLALAACHEGAKPADPPDLPAAAKLEVTSTAFAANAEIPTEFTGEGGDATPPLAWSGAPAQTKSFALIVDDPDAPDPKAPKRTWVHWVLAAIPASATAVPATGAIVGKSVAP